MTKYCPICGNPFEARPSGKGYCKPECWRESPAYRAQMVEAGKRSAALRRNPAHRRAVQAARAKTLAKSRLEKYRALIKHYGFWATPELLELCQDVWRIGMQAGASLRRRGENAA